MPATQGHLWTAAVASFLASLVECVEALTVVLAVGSIRGWRAALIGAGSAVGVLTLILLVAGSALTRVPLPVLQLVVGTMLLLFGMRWLRKAVLRSAGLIPLHDEAAAFEKNAARMATTPGALAGWDKVAFATSFNITMLEGTEVVFIVIAVAAGGPALMLPASLGAVAALVAVTALGVLLHRPLARVPENTLKFIVGILLSAFGCFWTGEGMGLAWPYQDWSLLGLVAGFLLISLAAVPLCRRLSQRDARLAQETV
jgi:uncharacterized membrane protein